MSRNYLSVCTIYGRDILVYNISVRNVARRETLIFDTSGRDILLCKVRDILFCNTSGRDI